MKNIILFYFSGTGNTRNIVNLIKDRFQMDSNLVEIISIEEFINLNRKIHMDKYDLVGIGYPIYGFREPRIIQRFVKVLPQQNHKDVFIFKTGADFITINNYSSSNVIRKLSKKGYHIFYDRIICMGSNWLVGYKDEVVKQLYKCAIHKVEIMCKEVHRGEKRLYRNGYIFTTVISIIHWFEDNFLARIFGRSLKISKKCNQCGRCVKNCPSKNININKDKITFSNKCFLCMRCIYKCPNNAISSRGFNFLILKEGYRIDEIIDNQNISDKYITSDTKGYMKHFLRYLTDDSL